MLGGRGGAREEGKSEMGEVTLKEEEKVDECAD